MTGYTFTQVAGLALLFNLALSTAQHVEQSSAHCGTVCQHVFDHDSVGSIGRSIGTGAPDSLLGRPLEPPCKGYDASAMWKIWASALDAHSASSLGHLSATGLAEDRVCVDKVTLAKLTVAASSCHEQSSGGTSFDFSGHGSTGGMEHHDPSISTGPQTVFPPSGADNSGAGTAGNAGAGAGAGHVDNSGSGGSSGNTGSSSGSFGSSSGNTGSSSSSSNGGDVTHSSTGWGHGNVNDESICFKIKDKQTDRYLTSGGVEYAFAYYPNYYSIFRAYPSKSHPGAYTMTERSRSGSVVNYPVKLGNQGEFKPYYGDKDALFTFAPAAFGDSCWGVPGKKMSRRHDWSSWGSNYRQVSSSSAEDCADIELEEADCPA